MVSKLALGHFHIGLRAQYRRGGLVALIDGLGIALVGLDTLVAQTLVAIGLLAGVPGIGFGTDQLRAGRLHGGLLLRDLALRGLDVRIAGLDGRILLVQHRPVVAQIDTHQRIPGLHDLVVDHIDLVDVAADPGCHRDRIGTQIRIVRGLDEAAVHHPAHPVANADERDDGEYDEEPGADASIAVTIGRGRGGGRISHGRSCQKYSVC